MSNEIVMGTSPDLERTSGKALSWIGRSLGAILLFLVGYIHLALMVNMFGLSQMLGKLFLLNAIGAFAALVLILITPKWYGWVLGVLVSGGAAFAKLGMHSIPWLGSFIMGGSFAHAPGGGRPPTGGTPPSNHFGKSPGKTGFTSKAHGAFAKGGHAGGFGPSGGHHILPIFGNMGTLGPISVDIEIAFVALSALLLVMIVFRRSRV